MKSKAAAAALLLNVKTPKRCSDSAITALKSQSNVILQIAQNFFPRGGKQVYSLIHTRRIGSLHL